MTAVLSPRPRSLPGARRRGLVIGAVLVTLLALGGAGYLVRRGDIAHGVEVLGVGVGGRTRGEAAAVLRRELAGRGARTVPVRLEARTVEVLPRDVGLQVDVAATIDAAASVRRSSWVAPFSRHDVPPVVRVDPARLAAELRRRAGDALTPAVRARIRFDGLAPAPVYPAAGRTVDPEHAADAFRSNWLRTATIEVPTVTVPAGMTRQEVDALVNDLARPAVAAPVTVTTPHGSLRIPPSAVAAALELEADTSGRISPRVDPGALRRHLRGTLGTVEQPPRDASVALRNGSPTVAPHTDGRTVDLDRLAADLPRVLSQRPPSARTVTASMRVVPARLTTDAVTKLGVKQKVSSFTTRFTAGQPRTVNIKRMADLLRGTVVMPGKTFSLNGTIGERTADKGFVDAPSIAGGGVLKNTSGGGVSQVATTTFNAMYYAGLRAVEHRPHSYYFSRYPSVLEATVSWPDLDLKFRNDSPYGVLIDTSYTDTSVTVSIWSTKRYDVRTVYGPRTRPSEPRTVRLKDEDCLPTAGLPGFEQEAWRVFKQNGKEIKRERFFWRYQAEPRFICEKPGG